MPRNLYPPDLWSTVAQLWHNLFDQTPEGLKRFAEAVFSIEWVAKNVPRNQRTLSLMAKMVRDLIIVCYSDMIQNHLIDARLPPLWN